MIKALKPLAIMLCVALSIVLVSTPFAGCKKTVTITNTEHDTTIVHIHDTTVIVDTFYDLKNGLVAYYNFNNGSLKDSSGLNNDITFNNATPATDRFGKANNAFEFNGTSSYMKVSNSTSLNPSSITMFAIFKVNGFYQGPCHGNAIIDKGVPDRVNGFYFMRYSDFLTDCAAVPNAANEQFHAGFGDALSGTAPGVVLDAPKTETGQWYYLTYTYDGYLSKIYLNGTLIKTVAGSGTFTPNSQDLFLGRKNDSYYQYFFNGVMDEVRIYSRALSGGEVAQLSKLKN